ncbi:MAG: RluA family pseudouridine synthase [Candidatus Paceibacterota bacterium]|jgi:23S rRNA pseudouridine1911/1915/1917 synthase
MENIHVEQVFKPLRLDKYLSRKIKDISREKINFLIKEGKVKIKGKQKLKPSILLKGGEEISLDISGLKENEDSFILEPQSIFPEPEILYEDKNFIVLDKPSGIIVHPSLTNFKNPSIISWLIGKYPFLSQVGEDKLRPGIVHRLDKDTSGVLIVAKNNFSFNYFKNLFKTRKIKKKYIALVKGELKNEKGEINLPLARSKKSPTKRKVVTSRFQLDKAKTAITKYSVIKRYKSFTLLEVFLETGRTHQIRVHLASIGFPVVGDKIYGKSRKKEYLSLSRQFLHAQEISFISPAGKFLEIKSSLPQELVKVLRNLTPQIN